MELELEIIEGPRTVRKAVRLVDAFYKDRLIGTKCAICGEVFPDEASLKGTVAFDFHDEVAPLVHKTCWKKHCAKEKGA